MTRTLSFTDFVEYVLVRLYDLDTGEAAFVDVNRIASELKASVPSAWPLEAVQYLDQRGLVVAALAMASSQAVITGAGRILVEQRERERSSIVHEYRFEPQNIVAVTGTGNQVSVGNQGIVTQTVVVTPELSMDVLGVLAEIEVVIRSADSISDSARSEYLADIASARAQLEKREPNKAAIVAVLDPLSKVAAIAGPVLTVLKMLGVG